jgi:hypothetical protein
VNFYTGHAPVFFYETQVPLEFVPMDISNKSFLKPVHVPSPSHGTTFESKINFFAI